MNDLEKMTDADLTEIILDLLDAIGIVKEAEAAHTPTG